MRAPRPHGALRLHRGVSNVLRRLCRAQRLYDSAFCEDSTELYGCSRVFSCILQGLHGALRVLASVFVHFSRTLRSGTGARVCFLHFTRTLQSSTGAYVRFGHFTKTLRSPTRAYVRFGHFTKTLRSSTGARVCFQHFTRTLRSSTGARVRFRAVYNDSTELYGGSRVFSCILQGLYGALQVVA